MNYDRVQADNQEFRGRAQRKWARLTNFQLAAIDGERDALCGTIQEAYGVSKAEAERQIREWETSPY